ncbi:T9SS type A sorting domain-containing protein [Fluviicola taffensis]|uniref:Secretion system C-terminal sorting domain-containing protein n=1 Tax=Fluviicola taffensis (strain DSM 16823 / NCIMB 13979 / RW262) TaxID=755732 RepID=F2IB67_FLUTR|nr:T9SS type A sorting domain-containing protein [Fluviicola taffensis]AEA42150.1 hypothetical protein Fluta_0140 [Fluviicola taffensis DSM 16823]
MKLVVLTCLFTISFMVSWGQTLTPVSLEQLVNTDIPTSQFNSQIAADPSGGYVIIWTTAETSGTIMARRYDSSHSPITSELTINTDNSKSINIEYWKNGKYIISFIETSGPTLKFLILDELNVVSAETTVPGSLLKYDLSPKGDSLSFLYSKSSNNQLYLRGYNLSTNNWINTEVLVSEITGSSASYDEPNIVYHPNGRMTAIYHLYINTSGCCTFDRRVMRKTFSSSYLAEAPEYALWSTGSEYNVGNDLDASGNNNGEVIVTTTHGTTSSQRYMRLWILANTGSAIVNNAVLLPVVTTNDWYDYIEGHLYDNGDFLISKSIRTGSYTNPNDNEAYVIYGSNYNASNSGLLRMNSTLAGEQEYVSVAKLPNGGFVGCWSGNGFQGDARGIYSRAYNAVAFPSVSFSNAGTYVVNETGTTITIGVALATQPTANVTVNLSSSDLTEGTISTNQLTFTTSNWNVPQNVIVTGVDDTADDGDITFNLVASTTGSADATYAGLADKNQAIVNKDNDAIMTMPSAQSFCKSTGMSGVNAIITNVGSVITAVTASSNDQNVVDNSDISITNLGSGTYGVSISNLGNNTTGTAQITLTANDGQFNYSGTFNVTTTGVNLVINASSNAICLGQSVTLTASGGQNISWNNGVSNGVAFTPGNTATYTVTADNGSGCSATASQIVTVASAPAVPTITSSGSTAICGTGSVTLTSSAVSGNSWSNGSTNQSITVSTAGTYTVTHSTGGACSATSTPVNVTVGSVPNAPIITPNGPTTFCAGGSVILTSSQAIGNTWSTSANAQSINVTSTNTYMLTYTDGNGCVSPATSILVTVQSAPNVSAGVDQTVCEGTMVTLFGSGAASYVWTGGVTNGTSFPISNQTTFEVTGTGSNGCTATDQVTIFVNNTPNVSAGPNLNICNGESITLNGSGAATYDWDNGVTNGVSFIPTLGTTTYTVTGTSVGGCEAEDQMTVTVNQLPNVTISNIPAFCLSDGAAALNQGSPSGGTYSGTGINGTIFTPATAGLGIHPVTYTYSDLNGCEKTASSTITVDICLGVEELAANQLVVYPNPTIGLTTIELPGEFQYSLLDAQGRIVLQVSASDSSKVDLTAFSDGVYQLLIQSKNEKYTLRIVKN